MLTPKPSIIAAIRHTGASLMALAPVTEAAKAHGKTPAQVKSDRRTRKREKERETKQPYPKYKIAVVPLFKLSFATQYYMARQSPFPAHERVCRASAH